MTDATGCQNFIGNPVIVKAKVTLWFQESGVNDRIFNDNLIHVFPGTCYMDRAIANDTEFSNQLPQGQSKSPQNRLPL